MENGALALFVGKRASNYKMSAILFLIAVFYAGALLGWFEGRKHERKKWLPLEEKEYD